MSKRLAISVMAIAMAAMVSSVASAGSARTDGQNGLLPVSDIALSLLSYGLAPESDAVLRGPYYVLHATNPWGREVRVVADAYFGDILSVEPVYSWRTNQYLRHGTIARIIHVPQDIYGGSDANPSLQKRSDATPTIPRLHAEQAKDDQVLSPVYPTPNFGPKVDNKVGGSAPFDRLPPPPSQRVE